MAKKKDARRQRARQQKRAKRARHKSSIRVGKASRSATTSEATRRIRRAGTWPLLECLITDDWRESGLATILLSRQRPNGGAAVGSFLVDTGCLGLKNAFANDNFSLPDYQRLRDKFVGNKPMSPCAPAYAAKLVNTAIAYANELGFRPPSDSAYALEIFGDINSAHCIDEIRCGGDDGRPYYVSGPDDDVEAILSQLESRLGPDGFTFSIMTDL